MQEIIDRPAKILTQSQREAYFDYGFIGMEGFVDKQWLERLNKVTNEFIEISKTFSAEQKDRRFDVEPDHRIDKPRLRRLNSPADLHEEYWAFASKGPFVDVAEDLLGPDVKFHHSKLNFKWSGGGEEVKWHQDIQFWPHTNFQILTIGVYLEDVTPDMAPMGVIPGSHKGQLYDLYDQNGAWRGNISENEVSQLETDRAVYMSGPAGSITVHNCRSVHGSPPNTSDRPRPLLLCAYSAAHAIPITDLTRGGKYSEAIVRGEAARWARFDPRPVLMPPDWSRTGYQSIFEHQQDKI